MLRAMRGAAETWIIKVLMVFLVISFSIWGVGDIFRGNPQQRVIACIDGFYLPLSFFFGSSAAICTGKVITAQDLTLDFQRSFDSERQRRGIDFTPAKAVQQGMLEQVLREAVARQLFDHAAKDFSLRYDSRAVLEQLAKMPELRTKDGKFDQNAFRRIMGNMRMDETAFLDYVRRDFAHTQSIGIFGALANLPQSLSDQLMKAQGQEMVLQLLRLPHDKMPAPPAPDQAVLEKFQTDHAKLFTAPEYRSISLLQLVLDDVSKGITVSDADVAAAFATRAQEFAQGERRDLLQVVMADEAEAKALAARAQASRNLRQAATVDKMDVVVLEDQSEETIPSELYTTVFTAEPGTISDPIKTDFGYHIVQLVKIKPPYKPTLAEVSDKLRAKIQRERGQEAIQELANKVDDELAAGRSLDEIATAHQLRITAIPVIDSEGNDAAGKKVSLPLGSSGIIIQNAFGLGEGESSTLLDDHRGNFIVVHVEKITPAQLRAFTETKEKVLAAWQAEQQRQAAAAEADKVLAEWQTKPQGLAELSKRPRLIGTDNLTISAMGGPIAAMPASLQQKLFSFKQNELAVGEDAQAHYVVRLAGFRSFDATKNAEAQASFRNRLINAWRGDVVEQIDIALRAQHHVRINQPVFNAVQQSFETKAE
jgi:peptidyl-prolyl cis-trans isomerase D